MDGDEINCMIIRAYSGFGFLGRVSTRLGIYDLMNRRESCDVSVLCFCDS